MEAMSRHGPPSHPPTPASPLPFTPDVDQDRWESRFPGTKQCWARAGVQGLQGTPNLWGPITYLHIWGMAVVDPTCKQTAVNSVPGASEFTSARPCTLGHSHP